MLEEVLKDLEKARVLRVSHLEGKNFYLLIAVGDEEVELTARGVEILSSRKVPKPAGEAKAAGRKAGRAKLQTTTGRKGHSGFVSIFEERSHWPEHVLRAEGLPLYWNEQWLRAELERLGSYFAIEQEWGYPNATVSAFAKRNFGIEVRPRKRHLREVVRQVYRENPGLGLEKLAERTGVSKATAYRYVRDLLP